MINRRSLLLDQLADAERSIVENETRIRQQKQLIADQERDGRDSAIATELLCMLRDSYTLHVATRDRIKAGISSL
jgi:hypothetical protein